MAAIGVPESYLRMFKFSMLPHTVRMELAKFLDCDGMASWEALAEALGCPPHTAMWMKSRTRNAPMGSSTLLFFDEYCIHKDLSLVDLVYALEKINNLACVSVLQTFMGTGNGPDPVPDLPIKHSIEVAPSEYGTAAAAATAAGTSISFMSDAGPTSFDRKVTRRPDSVGPLAMDQGTAGSTSNCGNGPALAEKYLQQNRTGFERLLANCNERDRVLRYAGPEPAPDADRHLHYPAGTGLIPEPVRALNFADSGPEVDYKPNYAGYARDADRDSLYAGPAANRCPSYGSAGPPGLLRDVDRDLPVQYTGLGSIPEQVRTAGYGDFGRGAGRLDAEWRRQYVGDGQMDGQHQAMHPDHLRQMADPQLNPHFWGIRAPVDPALMRFASAGSPMDTAGRMRFASPGPPADPARIRYASPGQPVDPARIRYASPGPPVDPARIRYASPGPPVDPARMQFIGPSSGSDDSLWSQVERIGTASNWSQSQPQSLSRHDMLLVSGRQYYSGEMKASVNGSDHVSLRLIEEFQNAGLNSRHTSPLHHSQSPPVPALHVVYDYRSPPVGMAPAHQSADNGDGELLDLRLRPRTPPEQMDTSNMDSPPVVARGTAVVPAAAAAAAAGDRHFTHSQMSPHSGSDIATKRMMSCVTSDDLKALTSKRPALTTKVELLKSPASPPAVAAPLPVAVDKKAYIYNWIKGQENFTHSDNNNDNNNNNNNNEDTDNVVNMRRHQGATAAAASSAETANKRLTDPMTKEDLKKRQNEAKVGGAIGAATPADGGSLTSSSTVTDLQHSAYVVDNRRVRVFVTYTSDSRRHVSNVLRLCDCLKKNNFSVGLDVRETPLLTDGVEKTSWYDMRFERANYILILISPLYRRVIEGTMGPSDGDPSSHLNALYIYQRMCSEHSENPTSARRRFIAVQMPGAASSDIPPWLSDPSGGGNAVYIWPDQYSSLFYFMMRPAQVITEFMSRCRNVSAQTGAAPAARGVHGAAAAAAGGSGSNSRSRKKNAQEK